MKKVSFQTLGCKLNFAETSTIGRQFIDHGFEVVDAGQPADVFVLNTCTVTERADRECRQMIRRALRLSPAAFIIVTGCYSQLHPDEISAIDGVDLIVGSDEKFDLFKYAGDFAKKGVPDIYVSCIDEAEDIHPAFSWDVGGRTRAFLKIQDGCDYTCSFCTIPRARGSSRSIPLSQVLEQAGKIGKLGFREIVLTGVNVGDYGRKDHTTLLELLKRLDDLPVVERIRISSVEPNLLTRDMVEFIIGSAKICNHFHLPLQSGCDDILKSMRRRYAAGRYSDLVELIRQSDPSAGIGADVIVGFPGETEEYFNKTHEFLADLPISYLHVFTYSERPDTSAVSFKNPVNQRVRRQRNEILRKLGQQKREEFDLLSVGKVLEVLFEGKGENGLISGLSKNYIRIISEGDSSFINTIQFVKIDKLIHDACKGKILSQIEDVNQYQLHESSLPMNDFQRINTC